MSSITEPGPTLLDGKETIDRIDVHRNGIADPRRPTPTCRGVTKPRPGGIITVAVGLCRLIVRIRLSCKYTGSGMLLDILSTKLFCMEGHAMALHRYVSLQQGVSLFDSHGFREELVKKPPVHEAGSQAQVNLAGQSTGTAPVPVRRPGYCSLVLLLGLLSGCGDETDLARIGREALVASGAKHLEELSVTAPATSAQAPPESSIAPINGGPRAHLEGAFGPMFVWPVMPIHMVLLPDRRVLAYGTDTAGRQGAGFHYTVWDPKLGGGPEAFLTLPNVTGTDIFCSAQSLLPDGRVVLMGGDENPGTPEDFGNADVNVFNPRTNVLSKAGVMAYQRWYPSLVVMPNGEQVVMGGRINIVRDGPIVYERNVASTPEVYTPGIGWRSLTGATTDAAYGSTAESFFYPRAWLAPAGDIFILGHDGLMFRLDPTAQGTLTPLAAIAPAASERYPGVMFAPGKIISMRKLRQAVVVDINGSEPVVQSIASAALDRQWGNATVLADGQVWLNGGSTTANVLNDAHYVSELWNPTSGLWTPTARATQARLYHSASILLPDASVLTGGGGAYGPVSQLNGEVWFPPYLFRRDGSGRFAPRPGIATAPTKALVGGELTLTLPSGVQARRLTLVRTGSVTHSFNHDQRFMELPFTQTGVQLRATLPANVNALPPGHYMVFIFNGNGVPSKARMLRITAPPPS
ncbi:glyoxal oxidase [Azohydromonas australica]|uniref:glyoxal oxidase n=1 Tax=Azohydromonas australica TaxID=364039 RepID=UPI00146E47F2|nr:glyoxal oxidase [Azohydromonas australica]